MSHHCPRRAVRSLLAAQWTEARIAAACGTSQSTVNRLKHGKQKSVSYELGTALIRLAERQRRPACGGQARALQAGTRVPPLRPPAADLRAEATRPAPPGPPPGPGCPS